MGGLGSGRNRDWCAKGITDHRPSLDIRRLKKKSLLEPGLCFDSRWSIHGDSVAVINVRTTSDHLQLSYRYQEGELDWVSMNFPVYIEWTRCHLGGNRPWFLCPHTGCGRRVAILYGGRMFTCRHCSKLAYQSQREQDFERAIRKAERIRERLGWEPGILNGKDWKPKGMHWRTYDGLTAQHDSLAQAGMAGIAYRLNL